MFFVSVLQMLACVPDLICLVELESGEAVTTDELRYGLRVALLVLPVPPLMSTAKALQVVGPQAFGYTVEDATYIPVGPCKIDIIPGM